MTDTPRRLLAYCIAVILGAFTLALTIAVFMHIAPGLGNAVHASTAVAGGFEAHPRWVK